MLYFNANYDKCMLYNDVIDISCIYVDIYLT